MRNLMNITDLSLEEINELIASTGYVLVSMGEKSGFETYGLTKADGSAGTSIFLVVMLKQDATSGKVTNVSLVGSKVESEATKGLLRAVTEATIKVVDAENANGMIDEMFKTEPDENEDSPLYSVFNEKLMLAYIETSEVADDPATEDINEATPAMAMYVIYAIEIVEIPEEGETKVWISETGTKYHSDPACSGMENPVQKTKSEAESDGLTPCQNCYNK